MKKNERKWWKIMKCSFLAKPRLKIELCPCSPPLIGLFDTLIDQQVIFTGIGLGQWHNRWGEECPPETSDWETFSDVSGKKEAREMGWKLRRKGGKLEMEVGKRYKKRWGLFFFFFFFFFLLFTFENDSNLFWVYQNGNFLPGKSISCREKNQE